MEAHICLDVNLFFLPYYQIRKMGWIIIRLFHLRCEIGIYLFISSIFYKNSEGKFHSNSLENLIESIILIDCFYVNISNFLMNLLGGIAIKVRL